MKLILYFLIASTFTIGGCGKEDSSSINNTLDNTSVGVTETGNDGEPTVTDNNKAKVISVAVTGEATNYTFNVGVESPDTGCDQYADWWEVITEEGELVYRRILAHSHVNEQPFVRSGSGISISDNQTVIVRVHMNNLGYSTQILKGSVSLGFSEAILEADFAANLETQAPLPNGCAF